MPVINNRSIQSFSNAIDRSSNVISLDSISNINLQQSRAFTLTLVENAVLNEIPTFGETHLIFYWRIKQDAVGGKILSAASNITFTGVIDYTPGSSSIIKFFTFDGGLTWDAIVEKPVQNNILWMPGESSEPSLTPSIWLDASDSTLVITSNNLVNQWKDKSGNNRHFNQSNSTRQPIYSLNNLNNKNVVVFDGINDWIGRDFSINLGNNISFLFVCRYDGTNASGLFDTAAFAPNVARNYSNNTVEWWNNDPQLNLNAPLQEWFMLTVIYSLSGTRKIQKWINDSNYDFAVSSSPSELAWGSMAIGSINQGFPFFQGSLAELIIIPSAVDLTIRQKLNGYLAHKWGLQSKLEANHPYKLSAPL